MTSRKPSVSEVKKSQPQKIRTVGSSETKNYVCEICEAVVKAEDKGIECEICKGWFHTGCVDLTDNEYEMLASHKLGTIHWYCATCNVKSVELLRLVFGLQDRIQKTEREFDNVKREINAKISKIESEYDAVREDLKSLNQKIEGVRQRCVDSDKEIRTLQHETRNDIENITKGMENKINKDDMEKALIQHTEMLSDETYASKIKNEVDQHLIGMDCQLTSVSTKIDEVRRKTIIEQDRESRISNLILYNVQEPTSPNQDERWKEDREFCLELFNKVLGVPIREDDIRRFVRLGRANLVQPGKARPVLIQFRDRILKNMVMESVSKLKGAEEKYSRIILIHDMNTEDREEYKRLVAEAKDKQNDQISGEYIFRVKGTPGNFRLLKIRRRY